MQKFYCSFVKVIRWEQLFEYLQFFDKTNVLRLWNLPVTGPQANKLHPVPYECFLKTAYYRKKLTIFEIYV